MGGLSADAILLGLAQSGGTPRGNPLLEPGGFGGSIHHGHFDPQTIRVQPDVVAQPGQHFNRRGGQFLVTQPKQPGSQAGFRLGPGNEKIDIPGNHQTDDEVSCSSTDCCRKRASTYKGGFYAVGLSGTVAQPIRISGPAADKPAVFAAETTGVLQLVQATHIEIENIHITRAKGNALAFDDGGKLDFSCHHITIRRVRIEDIGPEGTANAIKLAGGR